MSHDDDQKIDGMGSFTMDGEGFSGLALEDPDDAAPKNDKEDSDAPKIPPPDLVPGIALEESPVAASAASPAKTQDVNMQGGTGDDSELPPTQNEQSPPEGKKERMGDKLVSMGAITEGQLNVALQEKKVSGKLLGEILVDLGFIDEKALSAFLAESAGFEVFDPSHTIFDSEALSVIDKATALKYQILPISLRDDEASVVMADPYDVIAMDLLRRVLPKHVRLIPVVSTTTVISEAIDTAYGYASSISDILAEMEDGKDQMPDLTHMSDDESFSSPS